MTLSNEELYQQFEKQRNELSGILSRSIEVIEKLNINKENPVLTTENLYALQEKLQNETFKVQVAGTFKNGKSTFINSLLGEEVLPAYAVPCTAVINEVKWGEEKKAVIHFCNPLPERLPSEIPEIAMAHMRKYNMKDIPPLEIPYDQVEDYVVIPMGTDPSEIQLESPYEKVELFYPLPLLENGVEVIDSPGLNEHQTRTKVTMDYLNKADAILFVLNATAICAEDEMQFIENDLHDNGFEEPFFIVNRYDLIRERERARLQQFTHVKLDEFTKNGIYFVSALEALEAKENEDDTRFENSGMKTFEQDLTEYLTRNKGKAKLAQPTKELRHILEVKADKVIKEQKKMLGGSLDELKAKQAEITPRLEDLKIKKNQQQQRIQEVINRAERDISRCAYNHMGAIVNNVPKWVDEFKPETTLIPPTKKKMEAITTEILNYVTSKIEESYRVWRKKELEPMLAEKGQQISDTIESDLSEIFGEIDIINSDISDGKAELKEIPVWQRVVGVAGGLLLGDVGLAFAGGMNGIGKELAQTFAMEFAGGALLALLGALNPVTLILLIGGTGIFNVVSGQSNALKKVKNAVSDQIVENLRGSMRSKSDELTEKCCQRFEELAETAYSSVDTEIAELNNQIQATINEMKKGEASVKKREAELDTYETEIKELLEQLNGFIFQLLEA